MAKNVMVSFTGLLFLGAYTFDVDRQLFGECWHTKDENLEIGSFLVHTNALACLIVYGNNKHYLYLDVPGHGYTHTTSTAICSMALAVDTHIISLLSPYHSDRAQLKMLTVSRRVVVCFYSRSRTQLLFFAWWCAG